MTFHTLALVTCVAALLLGIGWLFAGKLMLQRWRIESSVGALLVGRRIGVIYLSVALLFLLYAHDRVAGTHHDREYVRRAG